MRLSVYNLTSQFIFIFYLLLFLSKLHYCCVIMQWWNVTKYIRCYAFLYLFYFNYCTFMQQLQILVTDEDFTFNQSKRGSWCFTWSTWSTFLVWYCFLLWVSTVVFTLLLECLNTSSTIPIMQFTAWSALNWNQSFMCYHIDQKRSSYPGYFLMAFLMQAIVKITWTFPYLLAVSLLGLYIWQFSVLSLRCQSRCLSSFFYMF